MRDPVRIVLAVTLISQLRTSFSDKATETSQIRELGGCNLKHAPFHMEKLTLFRNGKGETAIRGIYEVEEDLAPLTHVGMKVEKCQSYEDARSCEVYANVKFDQPCENFIRKKNVPWSVLFDTKPSMTCPLKKGNYTVTEFTLDPKMLVGLSGVYYKVEFKFYTGKHVVGCIRAGVEKSTFRKRKGKN